MPNIKNTTRDTKSKSSKRSEKEPRLKGPPPFHLEAESQKRLKTVKYKKEPK